jgi:dihydroorotate dehydrogenase electron transfer subunit
MPVQVVGEVLSIEPVGAYHHLKIVAKDIPEQLRPGHFVALQVGGPGTGLTLRRSFSVHRWSQRGVYGGTLEIVFAVRGEGTRWLADLRPHDAVDVVGPLGRPFQLPKLPTLPKQGVSAMLVGGGYGSAPLFSLGDALRERGCRVDFVLGASTEDRLFGVLESKRHSASVGFTTDDGSFGERGRVSDILPQMMERADTDVVYACGPMPMLAAVAALAKARGAHCQVAVEEQMACGIGVCMTCVLPIVGDDGVTRMARSCIEGPVFRAEQVRFADIGTVPPGTLGGPEPIAPLPGSGRERIRA